MKNSEPVQSEIKTRRKILAGIGLFSFFSLFRSRLFSKSKVVSCAPPSEKKDTIKVLSQDGQLVEVDVSKIKLNREKISDEELKNWIKKG